MHIEQERRPPWWREALLILLVTALSVQESYVASGALFTPRAALAVIASVALLLRFDAPLIAAAAVITAAALQGTGAPLLVLVFSFAACNRALAAAACAAAALIGDLLWRPQPSLLDTHTFGPIFLIALPFAIGLWTASRRRLIDALAGEIDHLRVERELRGEQAKLAERARIAAEMHDVLAHRLSLIALHTGVLQQRHGHLPAPIADRIGLLREAATDALGDLRDVLGALREPDPLTQPPKAPVLRDLTVLIDQARAAGQKINLAITGASEAIPTSHRLATERLVQEALTNVRKHAPSAAANVTVYYGSPATTVQVENGPAAREEETPVASGYGLIGLTERVTALRGELEYGHTNDGGWRIAARIPYSPHETGVAGS